MTHTALDWQRPCPIYKRETRKKCCVIFLLFFFFQRDTDGRTPLHFAAAKGSLKSVQLICSSNPNCINVEDNADQVSSWESSSPLYKTGFLYLTGLFPLALRQPDFRHFAKNYFSLILSLKNKFILQNETVVLVLCLRFSWYHAYMGTQTPEFIHSIVKKKNVQNISPGNLIMLILLHSLLGHRFAPGCQKWTCSHSDVSAIPWFPERDA